MPGGRGPEGVALSATLNQPGSRGWNRTGASPRAWTPSPGSRCSKARAICSRVRGADEQKPLSADGRRGSSIRGPSLPPPWSKTLGSRRETCFHSARSSSEGCSCASSSARLMVMASRARVEVLSGLGSFGCGIEGRAGAAATGARPGAGVGMKQILGVQRGLLDRFPTEILGFCAADCSGLDGKKSVDRVKSSWTVTPPCRGYVLDGYLHNRPRLFRVHSRSTLDRTSQTLTQPQPWTMQALRSHLGGNVSAPEAACVPVPTAVPQHLTPSYICPLLRLNPGQGSTAPLEAADGFPTSSGFRS